MLGGKGKVKTPHEMERITDEVESNHLSPRQNKSPTRTDVGRQAAPLPQRPPREDLGTDECGGRNEHMKLNELKRGGNGFPQGNIHVTRVRPGAQTATGHEGSSGVTYTGGAFKSDPVEAGNTSKPNTFVPGRSRYVTVWLPRPNMES